MRNRFHRRGRELIHGDRAFLTRAGPVARLTSGGFHKVLDRIDAGLVSGVIEVSLPDGTTRLLGMQSEGPKAVLRLRSWSALVRFWAAGSVGWYRAWAAGEWSSPDPVKLFELFMLNRMTLGNVGRAHGTARLFNRAAHWLHRNTRRGARRNIHAHYDLGNDFYGTWLDESMTYSSALFDEGETLELAQYQKICALLDRLDLKPEERVLEIGCGWGSLLEVAARDYGVHVLGLTLSTEQKCYADQRLAKAGLSDRAHIALEDYRDAAGTFDAIASVEMVEAVGCDYWLDYLKAFHRCLKPGGKVGLQYISIDDRIFEGYAGNADFIQTYIFPGGMLLCEPDFFGIAQSLGFDVQNRRAFGLDYARTLSLWRERFDAAVRDHRLPGGFDPEFVGLWRYYLMYCEGGFRGGGINVAQVTLQKT